MARKIQVKRGNQADLPKLDIGEFGFAMDQNRTFIGGSAGNVELANKAEVTSLTSQLADKVTKGEVTSADLKTLTDEDRIGLSNLKAEVIQAIAGTAPVNSIPALKSVTPERTSFMSTGVNKFDISKHGPGTLTIGYFIQGGSLIANGSYNVTAPIYLEPSKQYTLSRALWGGATAAARGSMYDKDGVYIGIWDNLTFTTPSNFAYVRFSVFDSTNLSNLMIVEGTTVPTTFAPYAIELNASIKLPQVNAYTPPLYVQKTGSKMVVASKYNKDNDRHMTIEPIGPNLLPQISKIELKANGEKTVSNVFTGATLLGTSGTDLVGPYVIQATNNADGDMPTSGNFTGGWHGYSGGQSGARTANNLNLSLAVDNRVITTDGTYGAEQVDITVVNGIYASNTKKADGTGREVLVETVRYSFKPDGKIEVTNQIKILEPLLILTYYGLQLPAFSYINGQLLFVGDNLQRKWITPATNANCGNRDQSFCRDIILTKDDHYISMTLDRYDMGNRQFAYQSEPVALTSGSKAYFKLISDKTFAANDILSWRGTYDFYYKK